MVIGISGAISDTGYYRGRVYGNKHCPGKRMHVCGTYSSGIRHHIWQYLEKKYSKEELEYIVEFCAARKWSREELGELTAEQIECVEVLYFLVPSYPARYMNLRDYPED